MTISFVPLDQDCQCFAVARGESEIVCQTCDEGLGADLVLHSPHLQRLLALDPKRPPVLPSVIVLNPAWEVCLAAVADTLAQLQATLDQRLGQGMGYLGWQQAALQLQTSLPKWSEADLAPLQTLIQAWGCDWLRLTPEITLKEPQTESGITLAWEMFGPVSTAVEHLGAGLAAVYGRMFQAKHLIYWQHQQLSPPDLCVEILIQPLQACVAAGWAEYAAGQWQIQAGVGVLEGVLQGRMVPDCYRFDAATGTRLEAHLGSKQQALTITPGQGLTPHSLTTAVAQEYALSPGHDFCLGQLLQTLTTQPTITADRYYWEISLDHSQAQLTAVRPRPVEANVTGLGLTLETVGEGILASSGQALAAALVIPPDAPLPHWSAYRPGYILVVESLPPEWLPGLRGAAGLVCERGGVTSHGAILARELGRPAVVGLAQALTRIQTADVLCLGGQTGIVSRCMGLQPLDTHPPTAISANPPESNRQNPQSLPPLWVNLSQAAALDQLPPLPLAGLGLLRAEMLFLELLEGQHPDYWLAQAPKQLQRRFIRQLTPFFQTFTPRPIFYRALDLRSRDLRGLAGADHPEPQTMNPDLGMRGLARICLQPELFQWELAALMSVLQHYPLPLRLVLPFARSLEEIQFCQQEIQRAGLDRVADFQLWVMLETPAMLFLVSELAGLGIKGICIGSNDLTQLLLGVDRDHPTLSQILNETHPAVKLALTQLIQTAQGLGLGCHFCGQAASVYPDWLAWLWQLGIDGVSLAPDALAQAWSLWQHAGELTQR